MNRSGWSGCRLTFAPSIAPLGKHQVDQIIPVHTAKSSKVPQDCGKCPDSQRVVVWYRDVMLGGVGCRQPHVGAGLSRDLIAEFRHGVGEIITETSRESFIKRELPHERNEAE